MAATAPSTDPVHLGVDVRADLRPRPRSEHERLRGQRPQRVLLHRLEHRGRRGAIQRQAGRRPAISADQRPPRPASAPGCELPAAPEAVAHIRHRASTLALSRVSVTGGVYQAPVVSSELSIGPVELRVVQIGLVHPGLQVVRHQPRRDAAEELKRRDMALGPGALVHLQHRPHEHVPRAAQDHHERPHRASASRKGPASGPAARNRSAPVPSLSRCGFHHPHLRPAGLLRHVRRHIPAEAGDADRQALAHLAVAASIVACVTRCQLLHDVVAVHSDRRPVTCRSRVSASCGNQPRTSSAHSSSLSRARPGDARLDRRREYLRSVCGPLPALRHLAQRPARMPVMNLSHVNHVERSPAIGLPPAGGKVLLLDGQVHLDTLHPGELRIAGELRER